jgi:hydrogenase nickel incorporation protein HypA/HybF
VHELSLAKSIVETVEHHAAGHCVTEVTMTIGALRQVVPESLEFYFELASRDSVCDEAVLIQKFVPVRARCEACQAEWEPKLPLFLCTECGGSGQPVSGEEFEIESIEILETEQEEVADAPH